MSEPLYRDSALYDAIYGDLVADVPFFARLAREAGGPVLEVCCGNGRLLVPAREAGADVDGIDLAPAMLDGLRAKLAARGLAADVRCADMRTFELSRRYALVFVGFNSFLHNLTQADQLATLQRCRAHLAPGGRLAIAVFHPKAQALIDWAAGEKLAKEVADPAGTGRVRVIDHAVDDRVEQVRRVARRVEFLDAAGTVVRTEQAPFELRYVYKPEMELLLRTAGFARWTVQPLDPGADGGLAPADRTPQEGDTLLWTAWQD